MSSNTYFNSVLRAAGAGNQGINDQSVQEFVNNIRNLQSQGIQNLPISVQNAAPVQQMPVQQQTPQQQYSVGGFVKNFIRNAEDIGTGLVDIAVHPEQLGEVIGKATVGAINNPEKILPTAWNLVADPYGLTTENIGKVLSGERTIGDLAKYVGQSVYNRPFEVALDALSLGTGKALGAINKGSKAARIVEDAANIGNAQVRREAQKLIDLSSELNKVDKVKLAQAIEYAETGKQVPKGYDKSVMKMLDQYSKDYQNLVAKFAPDQVVDPKVLSITQKYARDNGISFQQASKELTPYFDNENIFARGKEFDPNDINNYRLATKDEIIDNIKKQGYDVEISSYKAGESYMVDAGNGKYKHKVQQWGDTYPESKRVVFSKDAGLDTYYHELMHILNNKKVGPVNEATRKFHEIAPTQIGKYARGELKIADMPEPLREYFLKPKTEKLVMEPKTRTLTQEGKNLLEFDGTKEAKAILEGEELYNKGWIKPVTHGLAEVNKNVAADVAERIMAGRFSSRIFGNAKYEDIAKEISKPSPWLDAQLKDMVEGQLTREMLDNGTLSGNAINLGSAKDTVYIPRQVVEQGDISKFKGSATKTQGLADDIAIDKRVLDELDKQSSILRLSNPFKDPMLRDAYNAAKSTMLASGGYLVGNLQTGIANTLLNAGINPIGLAFDIGNTIASKSRLTKELGVYRNLKRTTKEYNTPVLKQIGKINAPIADLMNAMDAKIQNFIAETAAHTNLRRQGIPANQRVDYIKSIKGKKLADVIYDVKKVSLMNTSNTILPKGLQGAAGLMNPYWRWVDTAAQSSLYMLQKSPIMANYLLVDTLANVGLDREMQNRLNIGVTSDKPFVSYRYNPKTKEVEEVSAEFIPMLNTLRVGSTLGKMLTGEGTVKDLQSVAGTSIPAVTAISMAFSGKTKYGKPILRSHRGLQDAMVIQGDRRYTMIDGRFQEDNRFHPDEPISAAIRETIGWVPLFNRTLAPATASAASWLTGKDYAYYKPYDNAILGRFNINPRDNQGNMFVYGNPRRGASTTQFTDLIKGQYATPYYPERPMLPNQLINLQKSVGKQLIRDILDVQNLGGEL
jgi:hypothetical protein